MELEMEISYFQQIWQQRNAIMFHFFSLYFNQDIG